MLIDTNILIYADRGVEKAKELITTRTNLCISVITYMEYVPFCRNKRELSNFENMMKKYRFRIIEIDQEISMTAKNFVRQFALSHTVEMADALIAATAMNKNLTIVTSNDKHFRPITGLDIEVFRP